MFTRGSIEDMDTAGKENKKGHIHPISRAIFEIREIFGDLGFEVELGPEIETEHYNFDALNIPADHPARDMQDTFWIASKDRKVLRTHTSPVQVRYIETHQPPFRIVATGKVFRNEATDTTHEAQFHQVEGLLVDRGTSLAELKGTLEYFFKKFFGPDVVLRMRPSYFPFTEPSVEVDIQYQNAWLEVMGAGLVNPAVLASSGLDSREWNGFAFGGCVGRLVMIKYRIPDIRMLFSGDLRLVNQW